MGLGGWIRMALCLCLVPAGVLGGSGSVSGSGDDAGFAWRLPPWIEPPAVPADNPMSEAKVELGRRLFYDVRLSSPGYVACSTCHDPARAFTDGRRTAVGVTGEFHPRNSPGLANVAYQGALTWADPELRSLEAQVRVPLFNVDPVEMAVAGFEDSVLTHFRQSPVYPEMFRRAFPGRDGRIDFATIAKAIAAFERTLISATSPYDLYRHAGARTALSPAARRGAALFFGERMRCGECHSGLHLSDAIPEPRYHNTGLYNLDGAGALPDGDQGLIEHTGRPEDMGRFRTPSLRNVAVTAPYMHDGSLPTLTAVIDHYAAGGAAARQGRRSPLASPLVAGFEIDAREKSDLLAFLHSLTDREFLSDPRFQTPFQ